jgi:hypothetical protein
MNLVDDYKLRNDRLRQGLRPMVKLHPTKSTMEQVIDRLNRALDDPTKPQKALRNAPFVTGRAVSDSLVTLDLIGYRARQKLPSALDPNKILKPHMVVTLVPGDGGTSVSYSFNIQSAARRFYILMALSPLLVILSAVFAITLGFHMPSLSFFSLLLSAVSFIFAMQMLNAVPDAILDEEFLEEWLIRLLD